MDLGRFLITVIDPSGGLIPATPQHKNSGTGIEFIYNNWEKFKFTKNNSTSRSERVDFMARMKKSQAFTNKQLVIPAFYRDIDLSQASNGKLATDTITKLYAKLIRMVSGLTSNDTKDDWGLFSFVGHNTRYNIQMTLVEIFKYFIGMIKGKNGIFRKSVMGKSVDYGIRAVISSPSYRFDKYTQTKVSFTHCGVPLNMVIHAFAPFIKAWCLNFLNNSLDSDGDSNYNKDNHIKQYDDEFISKAIKRFDKFPDSRFDLVTYKSVNHEIKNDYIYITTSDDERIKLTWAGLFYMAAFNVVKDKHVYITRYPLENHMAIFPSKVNTLSSMNTRNLIINGVNYPDYPVMPDKLDRSKVANQFIDALQMANIYVTALGADFDGDQVTIRGVFTQEANEEAHNQIYKLSNILSTDGENIRQIQQDSIQTLYNLTK